MGLPGFLIIGAAKCGTTTLYQYLARHPSIFMPEAKEPQFFSDGAVYHRGEAWYRSLFSAARDDQICGEASTTYTRWPHTDDAAPRIARLLPDVRLIYLMRHPVERAYSHYAHHMRFGVTMTFEEALEDSSVYVDCSMYMRQIERYLRYFPRDRILPILLSDLKTSSGGVLADVQGFLGIPPLDLVDDEEIFANVTGPDHFIRKRTTLRLRRIPGGSTVAELVPAAWRKQLFGVIKRSPVGRRIARQYRLPPMLPDTRRRLLVLFRKPNAELVDFLGRDLSEWSS